MSGPRGGAEILAGVAAGAADAGEPFPPAFLRLLAAVPALVRRARIGAAAGVHAARGPGGPFLFRGHREYRPGDDLRRVDWGVLARHDRVVVREFEAERDARTDVWVDASASVVPFGGLGSLLRASALAAAVGLAGGGRVRLGVLRGTSADVAIEADDLSATPSVLDALRGLSPAGHVQFEDVLPLVAARAAPRSRQFLVSDLLTAADPGLLRRLAGRGLSGGLLHLRVPEVFAPPEEGLWDAEDAETGVRRTVRWTPALAASVAARAEAHAERWARHAREVGLAYLPFAPSTEAESLLSQLALEVP